MRQGDVWRIVVSVLAIAGAGVVIWTRGMGDGGSQTPEWFYDLSEKRLYAVPRGTIPPHRGIGGAADDGVRAVVVACKGSCGDASARRIAYLEMFTPELVAVQSAINTAKATGQPPPEDKSRDFFSAHTLVRRVDGTEWHAISSAQGLEISREWMADACPDGKPPTVCTP